MVQCGAGKRDQWRGYMSVVAINHGSIKSISRHTVVIYLMINFNVDKPRDYFCQVIKGTLGIHLQLSTLSALDLDRVHHFPHSLLQERDTYCLPEGIRLMPNTLH